MTLAYELCMEDFVCRLRTLSFVSCFELVNLVSA